jgi:AcrR family transcriptional regulator
MSSVPDTEQSEERRVEVMEATMIAIAELGAAHVTVRELGRRTGMSAGHILYYFGSRERILVETLRWSEADLGERRRRTLAGIGDPWRRAMRWAELALPSGVGDVRWGLWVQVAAAPPADAPTRRLLRELEDAWTDDLAAILGAGLATGTFGILESPREVAARLSILVDGLAFGILRGVPGNTHARAARTASSWFARELLVARS